MTNDLPHKPRRPADENPLLHRYLAALPPLAPPPGLADRVLVRVYRPLPPWAARLRSAGYQLVSSGRIWFLIAPFAVGALVSGAAGGAFVLLYADEVWALAGPLFVPLALAAWDAFRESLDGLWAAATDLVMRIPGPRAGVLLPLLLVWALCALGLYRTLHLGESGGSSSHAER